MSSRSIHDVFEELKELGPEERRIIEDSEEISRIVNRLATERVQRGYTQRKLAEKCGLKQAAIARMESLQAIPRLDTLVRVASCLDIKLAFVPARKSIDVQNTVIDFSSYRQRYRYNLNNGNTETYSIGGCADAAIS